jgi:hypothetical protein
MRIHNYRNDSAIGSTIRFNYVKKRGDRKPPLVPSSDKKEDLLLKPLNQLFYPCLNLIPNLSEDR